MGVYIPNPRALIELVEEPEFGAGMGEIGEGVADAVRSAAPHRTGAYEESIFVAQDGPETVVGSEDFAAHIVEYGSRNNPAYAPLRTGARSAGVRLEEH